MARTLVLLLFAGILSFMAIRAAEYDALEMAVRYYRADDDIEQVAFLATIIGVIGVV